MCQADDAAKCTDGVAPDGALHPGSGGDAVSRIDNALLQIIQIEHDDADLGSWLLDAITALGYAKDHLLHPPRPMVGILGTLTPEQRAALFAYDGPEYLGPDEEPRSGDTVRAEDQSASLTHKNNLGTVELTDD